MIRRRYGQQHLAQLVLFGVLSCRPEELMDPVLRRVDALLDDEALVDIVEAALARRHPQSRRWGRPGVPAETVLRMLALRYVKNWSYDQLEVEVTGNVVYRRFCRIDGHAVPDAKTLIKLHRVVGAESVRQLLERVVKIAIEKKVTRGRRMRVDSTVVEAPIRHPTDSGLCEDVIRVLSRAVRRLQRAGIELSFHFRNVKRSVSRRMREIAQALRTRGKARKNALVKAYRKLLAITGRVVRQTQRAVNQGKAQLESLPSAAGRQVERTLRKLGEIVPRAKQVIRQTRARVLRGDTTSEGKLISLFEPDAQILRRGKLHKPTEFGRLVKVQESEGGIVTDIDVVDQKNDKPLLVPAAERHRELFGRAPDLAATDRGFHSTDGENALIAMGVRRPVIPKPGYRSRERIEYENQRWFKKGRSWRVGGEARIARLKHTFGMQRSRNRGKEGMRQAVIWAGIVNNLVAIGVRAP